VNVDPIHAFMRFHQHEHKAITDSLRDHGIDPAAVLFIKRRGWVHLQLKEHVRSFAFHRKKRTVLDEQGHWQETIEYMVNEHGQAKEGLDLQGMIAELRNWLSRCAPSERSSRCRNARSNRSRHLFAMDASLSFTL
jgi:hypothetical protein